MAQAPRPAGHTPRLPVSLPPLILLGKGQEASRLSLPGPGEEAVTAGALRCRPYVARKETSVGVTEAKEGRGGVSPEDPAQQLLLLLLELP